MKFRKPPFVLSEEMKKAIHAVRGEAVDLDISGKNIFPISAQALKEQAEQRIRRAMELREERRKERESRVVIDCREMDQHDLIFKNGEKGPLLRALEGKKLVILDAFDEMKPDLIDGVSVVTASSFYMLFPFLNGEVDFTSFYNERSGLSNNLLASYKRSDINPDFKLLVVVSDIRKLAPSLAQRLINSKMVCTRSQLTSKFKLKPN